MNETQFEVLKNIEASYLEISRITNQVDLENDDSTEIFVQREKLLNEIDLLQKRLKNCPLGADEEQIKEVKRNIKNILLSVMSDSDLLLEEAKILHVSLKEKISKTPNANKAAQSYAAFKR